MLQPVLENAIIHATDDPFKKFQVRIVVSRLDNILQITVSDDGQGIPEDKIDKLLISSQEGGGVLNKIGIYNVHRRIRLSYGERYGVHVQSKWWEGTTVLIELPFQIEEHEK